MKAEKGPPQCRHFTRFPWRLGLVCTLPVLGIKLYDGFQWRKNQALLASNDINIQMNAEAYFVEQGPAGGRFMLESLDHPKASVREVAAHGLGVLQFRPAIEKLIALLEDDGEDRRVVEAAAVALGWIRDPRAGPALIRAIDGDYPLLRYYAALSLSRITGIQKGIDRPAWETWWNQQKDLPHLPVHTHPAGSPFLLTDSQLAARHFYRAVVSTPKDSVPAIFWPQWVDGAHPSLKGILDGNSLVHGIPPQDDKSLPLAIPAKILDLHQALNLRVRGRRAVVFGCPLGGYAAGYYTDLDGLLFLFGVSGYLRNSSMVPYDRKTESFWNPVDGTALLGPSRGRKLERFPVVHANWSVWKNRYPNTRVLSPLSYKNGRFLKSYFMPLYPGFLENDHLFSPLDHPLGGSGLPVKELVLGIHLGKKCIAYPVSELARAGGLIRDSFGKRNVFIQWSRNDNLAVARDSQGNYLPAIVGFWFVWHSYHPETVIYTAVPGKRTKVPDPVVKQR